MNGSVKQSPFREASGHYVSYKEFPVIYGARRFVAILTIPLRSILKHRNQIQVTFFNLYFTRSWLAYQLCLIRHSGLIRAGFSSETLFASLISFVPGLSYRVWFNDVIIRRRLHITKLVAIGSLLLPISLIQIFLRRYSLIPQLIQRHKIEW